MYNESVGTPQGYQRVHVEKTHSGEGGLGGLGVAGGALLAGGAGLAIGWLLSRRDRECGWGAGFPGVAAAAVERFPALTGKGCCPPAAEDTVQEGRVDNEKNFGAIAQVVLNSAGNILDRITTAADARQVQVADAFQRANALAVKTVEMMQNGFCKTAEEICAATAKTSAEINCLSKQVAALTCTTDAIAASVHNLPCELAKNTTIAALTAEVERLKCELFNCGENRRFNVLLEQIANLNGKIPSPAIPATGVVPTFPNIATNVGC